jgi:hypothetical protein
MFTLLISGCSLGLLVFCLYGIGTVYQDHQMETSVISHDYEWTASEPNVGLSEDQVLRIGQTSCIQQVVAFSQYAGTQEEYVSLSFDGIRDDPYFSALTASRRRIQADAPYYANVVAVPADSPLWDYYFSDELDRDAFLAGEIAVCYYPELMETEGGYYTAINQFKATETSADTTLFPELTEGTQLVISYGQREISLDCEQIIAKFPSVIQTSMDFLVPGSILISEQAYCELFDLDEMVYNQVFAYGAADADYTSDKLMSYVSTSSQISFSNFRSEKATSYSQVQITALFLGGIALVSCACAILMIIRHRAVWMEVERPRMELLKQLGCPTEVLRKLEPSNRLWLLGAVGFLDAALLLYRIISRYGAYYGLGTVPLGKIWEPMLQMGLYQFPLAVFFLAQAAYLVGLGFATKTGRRKDG